MRACGCPDRPTGQQPRVIGSFHGGANVRRRMRCDECDRNWTQIEVREDGEGSDADR